MDTNILILSSLNVFHHKKIVVNVLVVHVLTSTKKKGDHIFHSKE